MNPDTRAMTASELLEMPGDGNHYELVAGELKMMSPAGGRHGRIAFKLAQRIAIHVEKHQLGTIFAAETGFVLARNPDTVRAPDVAYVSSARLGNLADEPGYLPLAPDLVAEVVSPSDRSSEVEEKALDWLAAGVRTVLVVDPQTRSIRHYRSASEIHVHSSGTLDLGDVIDGFRLDVAELFA